MKLIVPLAGKGSRLRPVTNEVPKPLIKVAGRPVLDYVMDTVSELDIDEVIVITGHLKEDVESYIRGNFKQPARFVEQKVQDGTAGAIDLARPFVDGPVLIIFVDTLFDADLSLINRTDADGIIWAKEVEDYQRFGVIVTDEDGNMERIVEKPSEPISKFANIGVYYIRDHEALFDGIEWTLNQPKNNGEYFLTDAFQHMVDNGRKIKTAKVTGWYDCGKLGTTLETNAHLLANAGRARTGDFDASVTIVDPVRIEEGVSLSDCTIGPDVTVEAGASISGSTVSNSIVGKEATVVGATVRDSLLGEGANVTEDIAGMIVTRDDALVAP
jgi:glucose-1-phosphate thymidylyltransferase